MRSVYSFLGTSLAGTARDMTGKRREALLLFISFNKRFETEIKRTCECECDYTFYTVSFSFIDSETDRVQKNVLVVSLFVSKAVIIIQEETVKSMVRVKSRSCLTNLSDVIHESGRKERQTPVCDK